MADTEDTETLAGVLGAHKRLMPRQLPPLLVSGCTCGWGNEVFSHTAHLAQQVTSWLAARDERIRADEREKLAAEVEALAYEVSAPSWLGHDEIAAKIRALTAGRLAGEVEAQ